MVLENPAYKQWNFVDSEKREKWISNISVNDWATCRVSEGSFIEGRIEMINNYGIDINVKADGNGPYKFVRWNNVKSIRKTD